MSSTSSSMADALWDVPGARAHSDLSCTTGPTCGAPSRHHLGLERFVLHATAPLGEPSSRTRSGRSPLAQGVSTPPDNAYRNDLGASDPDHHRAEGSWREQPGLLAGNSPTLGAAAPRSHAPGSSSSDRGHMRTGPLVLVDRRHARTGRPRLSHCRRLPDPVVRGLASGRRATGRGSSNARAT